MPPIYKTEHWDKRLEFFKCDTRDSEKMIKFHKNLVLRTKEIEKCVIKGKKNKKESHI